MSSSELADVLLEMAEKLEDIRRNDPGGWTPEAKAHLFETERQLRFVQFWLERA